MTRLVFKFNDEKLSTMGYTSDFFLRDVREYSREHNITEVDVGVFEKPGDSMAEVGTIMFDVAEKHPEILKTLDEWLFIIDDVVENAIDELSECMEIPS